MPSWRFTCGSASFCRRRGGGTSRSDRPEQLGEVEGEQLGGAGGVPHQPFAFDRGEARFRCPDLDLVSVTVHNPIEGHARLLVAAALVEAVRPGCGRAQHFDKKKKKKKKKKIGPTRLLHRD